MPHVSPDKLPNHRRESISGDSHTGPSRRKEELSYVPIAVAVAAIISLAAIAAITTNESEKQVLLGEAIKRGEAPTSAACGSPLQEANCVITEKRQGSADHNNR